MKGLRFSQTWLFFGLLTFVFDNRFDFEAPFQISGYIKKNDMDCKIVKLKQRLREMAVWEQERRKRNANTLSGPYSWLALVTSSGPHSHDLDRICSSVAALSENPSCYFNIAVLQVWFGNPACDFISNRMGRDGCCSSEISSTIL